MSAQRGSAKILKITEKDLFFKSFWSTKNSKVGEHESTEMLNKIVRCSWGKRGLYFGCNAGAGFIFGIEFRILVSENLQSLTQSNYVFPPLTFFSILKKISNVFLKFSFWL